MEKRPITPPTERFRLRLIGDRRKRRRLYLSTFVIVWLAGAGILFAIPSISDSRVICLLLWLFVCIPIVIQLFRMPCIVDVSEQWFSIEILRGAPTFPAKTQTRLWGEMYGYQYKGLYEHEQRRIRPDRPNVGFVTIFLQNGEVFHFLGEEAETFLGYLKRRFPDKQQYPY